MMHTHPVSTSPHKPDPILAELWEIKRQINQEAGYRLEELTRMARTSAEKIRQQWDLDRKVTAGEE